MRTERVARTPRKNESATPEQIPWESKISKFPEPIHIETGTGRISFNYMNLEGNKIKYGFQSSREDVERDFGELVSLGGNQYALIVTEEKTEYRDKTLTAILGVLREKKMLVSQIINQNYLSPKNSMQ